MEPFAQKSIFIWNDFVIGTPTQVAALAVAAGYEAVYLHATHTTNWRTASRVALVAACKAAGLTVYGSVAVYAQATPAPAEGAQAAAIVNQYDLAGMVLDVESGAYELADGEIRVRELLNAYKRDTAKPAAFCGWAQYHSKTGKVYHNVKVLVEAMKLADVGMPMAYWYNGETPADAESMAAISYSHWRKYTTKPIVLAGRAYTDTVKVNGVTRTIHATGPAVMAFDTKARALGSTGITWWDMEHGIKILDVWAALAATQKFNITEEPGEIMDYKTYPMGLVTKTTARVKEPFGFIVYDLGGNDDADPNEQAKQIEADALASGKAPIAKWRFTTHWYGQNQKSATDAAWPKKEGDLPFQAFVDAVKNRSPYAVVVEIMDGTNFEGKPEDPFYLSYAAEQFVARVDGWLRANKPGVKVLVGSSNAFIEASSPRDGDMNAWVGKYPSYIIQPSPAVDASYPAGTAKPAHLDNRLTWEMWQYAGNLAIFNVASCGPINTWLNYTPGTPPVEEPGDGEPEPEEDTEELKLLKENNALLKKIAAHFA